ncbi:MAG: hypothetical protein ABIP33_05205 [Pseudolysinimonas sp.]
MFSQSHPLTASNLISELKTRDVSLDSPTLRELYRRGDLQPLAEITTRSARPGIVISDVPAARGSLQAELRIALASGRIRDPATDDFRPRLRFNDRTLSDPPRWMNGLIYSRWQLLAAPELRRRLPFRRVFGPYERRRVTLPPLDEWTRPPADRLAGWVPVLAALEARYLPTVDPEWLRLTNVEVEEWNEFRTYYDPVAMLATLQVRPGDVQAFADWLLHRARTLDPTGDWSRLIRRAPDRGWKTLTGDALIALDHRLAAEILLLSTKTSRNATPRHHCRTYLGLPGTRCSSGSQTTTTRSSTACWPTSGYPRTPASCSSSREKPKSCWSPECSIISTFATALIWSECCACAALTPNCRSSPQQQWHHYLANDEATATT